MNGNSKQILMVMAPSCHHCLFSVFMPGSQLPSRDINGKNSLGQVPLLTIHVSLAQERAVSYTKIQTIFNLNVRWNKKMIEKR